MIIEDEGIITINREERQMIAMGRLYNCFKLGISFMVHKHTKVEKWHFHFELNLVLFYLEIDLGEPY